MKIVIDIPENYLHIQSILVSQMVIDKVWDAVKEGTPLDDIKAEISRKANSGQWSEATVYGMQKALFIIDKCTSGKEK